MLDTIQLSIRQKCGGSGHHMMREAFRLTSDARVFRIDNVDHYCRNVLDWTAHDVMEMKGLCIRLPFPVCLFEINYEVTEVMKIKHPELKDRRRWRYGILGAYSHMEENTMLSFPKGVEQDKLMEGFESGFQKIGFLAIGESEFTNGKTMIWPAAMIVATINGKGEIIGDLGFKAGDGKIPDWKNQQDVAYSAGVIDAMVPVFYSLSLLNCKNVRTSIECNHTGKTRHQQKQIERAEWHWLDVPLINKIYSGEIPLSSLGAKKGLHVVRGHFKEYTADAPLLGKHVGRWWWGDSARGNIELGVVQKEYRPNARLLSAIKGVI